MATLKAFPYFGGKLRHLNFILDHLPHTERYIEPFGGSAAVLLNKEPVNVETYNDLDGEVVHFFQVLREQPDELVRRLRLTPYSRAEFEQAVEGSDPDSDIERARQFFTLITQRFNSLTSNASPGNWSYNIGNSGRERAKQISGQEGYIECLHEVAERFQRVQIESRPAVEVIETHDHPDALFYCDPPYTPDSRRSGKYEKEMDVQQHRKLASALCQCDAYVAISGYPSPLMDELYEGWNVYRDAKKQTPSSNQEQAETEVLWTNYDAGDGARLLRSDGSTTQQRRLSDGWGK